MDISRWLFDGIIRYKVSVYWDLFCHAWVAIHVHLGFCCHGVT